jgi:hypothetical protein
MSNFVLVNDSFNPSSRRLGCPMLARYQKPAGGSRAPSTLCLTNTVDEQFAFEYGEGDRTLAFYKDCHDFLRRRSA